MHKNLVWQAFLFVIFAATLWYTISALYSYYSYSHLNSQTSPSTINWEVVEKSEENYFLKTSYSFNYKGNLYRGSTTWSQDTYRNQWAAEQGLKESSSQQWKVWFDNLDPHHSSLQKNFPLKECISAAFLWGLSLYFLWIGFYVAKFKN